MTVSLARAIHEATSKRPQVGMKVQYGVIIDVRFPLVLVQFDEFGRRMKSRDQEWVACAIRS